MDLKPVGVHNHGRRADRPKVEAVLALLDEVFHGAAVAVESDNIPDRQIHVGYDECIPVIHLSVGFLNLYDNMPRLTPGTGLVFKLPKDLRVINALL